MSPEEAVSWLHDAQHRGIKLGLGTMRTLAESLGAPRLNGGSDRPGTPKIFHVAGTNGKGSVCAFIESILREAGIHVGLYTSPHLVHFAERIRIDGEMIRPEALAQNTGAVKAKVESLGLSPTFFELSTAVALSAFTSHPLGAWILETGMGGRLDATNLFIPDACMITPVDLDHQLWLGDTLEKIAMEKTGILKPGVPVFSSPQHPEARRVIQAEATKRGCPVRFVDAPYSEGPVGLCGSVQRWNAAVAVEAVRMVFPGISPDAVTHGVAKVNWPGRFQRIDSRTVLDGAHNPAAAGRLAGTWREMFGNRKASVVLAVLQDKAADGIVAALAPVARRLIVTRVRADRSRSPGELAEAARRVVPEVPCEESPDLSQALASARNSDDPILITGSLFLVGEFLEFFES